jgi:hypothetical protein
MEKARSQKKTMGRRVAGKNLAIKAEAGAKANTVNRTWKKSDDPSKSLNLEKGGLAGL